MQPRDRDVGFVWPPRPVVDPPFDSDDRDDALGVGPRTVIAPLPIRGPRTWWWEIERTWLGLTSAPFERRAAEAGWAPDPPDRFCPRCASTVGPYETRGGDAASLADGCSSCRELRVPWSRATRLGSYTGLLRDAILELKFTRFRAVGVALGRLLGRAVAAEARRAGIPVARLAIVPVPTTWRRFLARGIDHTAVLAASASREIGCPVVRALTRRHRPAQTTLSPSARLANVRDAFRARRLDWPNGVIPVVVDDVRTTGATLLAATLTLQSAIQSNTEQRSIWVATVAVTPAKGNRAASARSTPGVMV